MRTVQCLALACLISTPALAQTPNDKVPLTVTRAELQIIGQGLMELPYKTAAQVMNDLQAQLNAVDQAAAKATADAAKPAPDATKPAADATKAPAAPEPAKQ